MNYKNLLTGLSVAVMAMMTTSAQAMHQRPGNMLAPLKDHSLPTTQTFSDLEKSPDSKPCMPNTQVEQSKDQLLSWLTQQQNNLIKSNGELIGTVRKNYLSKMIEAANCTKEI